jgi:hypothetical protein
MIPSELTANTSKNVLKLEVFPLFRDGELSINFNSISEINNDHVFISNEDNETVFSLKKATYSPGIQYINLELGDLNSGSYQLNIKFGDNLVFKPFTKS